MEVFMKLEIKNLSKKYKDVQALDNVSMELSAGFLGVLGPNGAGKTTMMNIITGLLRQTRGQVLWDGEDILSLGAEYRTLLGYLPQAPKLYGSFSALNYLEYMAVLKDVYQRKGEKSLLHDKIDELLELVHLTDCKKRRIGTFSGGMRQRIGIAGALLGDPKIIILDEPTAGLDPQERVSLKNLVSSFSFDRIVIWATHITSDLEKIADKIAVISKGHLIKHCTPDSLLSEIQEKVWLVSVPSNETEELRKEYKVGNIAKDGNLVTLRIISDKQPHTNAVNTTPDLEDAYLYYV